MQAVTSNDGTKIAYKKSGSGPAVVLVDGATAHRAVDPTTNELARLLSEHFTVHRYDRRGRGESGDTRPFSKRREIEDLQAIVEEAGGRVLVFGMSSGGVLALDATAATPGIAGLCVYEPALIVDDSRRPVPADYAEHLMRLSLEDRRDEAFEYFLVQAVGIPPEYVEGIKQDEATWTRTTAVAGTIAYDAAFVGDVMRGRPLPTDRWAGIAVPVVVIDGGASDTFVHTGADALAGVLANATRVTLDGQTHAYDPAVLAPALAEAFGAMTTRTA